MHKLHMYARITGLDLSHCENLSVWICLHSGTCVQIISCGHRHYSTNAVDKDELIKPGIIL